MTKAFSGETLFCAFFDIRLIKLVAVKPEFFEPKIDFPINIHVAV